MKRFFWLVVSIAAYAVSGNAQAPAKRPEVFVIHGPAIIAFFVPVTQADLDNDADTNEAFSDFQYYVGSVKDPIRKAGIEFFEADALSFRIRVGKRIRTVQTGKIGVGYYFIAPGKKPHIESGVMTDTDLLNLAQKYFGIVSR